MTLRGQVALVACATRGAGRGTAVELGAAGATVYVTGRTSRTGARSPVGRAETIEETAELVTAAGGTGIAVRCDHQVPAEVAALARRIAEEQDGRLDVLVDNAWGGDQWICTRCCC
ncbi:MAG: SDR family NAD(P)-dependent oxidoreductase [Mycobacteriales bacterium]